MYQRVIPRDFFNESKLLKCMGQLALILHESEDYWGLFLDHDEDHNPGFEIRQNPDDGGLYVVNVHLTRKSDFERIDIFTVYNNKSPYPMHFIGKDDAEYALFTDTGQFTEEFKAFIDKMGD